MYQNIVTEIDAGVGIITLNRPERQNTLDDVVIDELAAAIAGMSIEDAVRVVVISSTGQSFCAGTDLAWLQRATKAFPEQNLDEARAMAEMLRSLAQMNKPTLARVQGSAHGSGVGLIAACDIAVATFAAEFSIPEVRLGIVPSVIGPYVIGAIGERHARRYMLTAERLSAAEAYRIGLVHEIVPDQAGLDDAIGEIVENLMNGAPGAIEACKEAVDAVANEPISGALIEDTARRIASIQTGTEARQRIGALLDKRRPEPDGGAEPVLPGTGKRQ